MTFYRWRGHGYRRSHEDPEWLAKIWRERRLAKTAETALATARREALEEAAKLCEGRAITPRGEDDCATYYACADMIRRLKDKQP